jgi:hypothetical protein
MEIKLSQNRVAIVDDEDFGAISAVKWCAHRNGCTFYAQRGIRGQGGKLKGEHMHRLVLSWKLDRDLAENERCDHVNGDGLDNRRENLRVATSAQNNRNCRRKSKNPTRRFLGVDWNRASLGWRARITIHGKSIYLGRFATELEAAQAREEYITANPELCARSNFPTEENHHG